MLLSFGMVFVSACSSKDKTESGTQASASPSASAAASASASPAAQAADPLGKYDPPINVSAVRIAQTSMKYENGDTIDNNAWIKLYADKLGINLKYDWVVPDQAAYDQKMNITIASGSLPDIMSVNATQFKDLSNNGQLADLTEAVNKYGSPKLKEVLNKDGGTALKASTVGGKLMALPVMPTPVDTVKLLWVRTDWLKKLNLPEPKTMQDVFAISDAFTNKDPDGNGKNDTFGLAITKDLYSNPGLTGFFNSYHAYPQIWVKDASGNVVWGSIQPQMKTALTKLAEMYKNGQLDKEFGVKDGPKVDESLSSSKVGMMYGEMWMPLGGGITNGKKLDPNVEWASYPLPSIDDKMAQPGINFGVSNFYVVKKGAKNPEAAVKMMNLYLDIDGSLDKTVNETYGSKDGIEKWKYATINQVSVTNQDVHKNVSKALSDKDTSKFNASDKAIYEILAKFREDGNVSGWAYDHVFGPKSSQELLVKYNEAKQILVTAFYGAPTPAMVSQMPALKKLELEEFTKIIMGASPPDAFDAFVANWKKLGGDDMTKEANDWVKSQK